MFKNGWKRFSIVDTINLGFLILLVVFYLFAFYKTPYRWVLAILYPALVLMLIVFSWLRTKDVGTGLKRFLMFAYPIIFLFTVFESFFMLLSFFNEARYDALMAEIDFAMLGVHPTVWFEQFSFPTLTEVLYVLYFFYFPMPFILFGWMYKQGMFKEMERSFLIFYICYYGAYLSYFLIPVQGPRFFLADIQTIELTGLFIYEPIRSFINVMEPNKLDAFPSLHAAILLVTMFAFNRYNRRMYLIFLPIAVGIMISLVYLRYHYVIDVLVGSVWAIASWYLGDKIYEKYHNKFEFHFGK